MRSSFDDFRVRIRADTMDPTRIGSTWPKFSPLCQYVGNAIDQNRMKKAVTQRAGPSPIASGMVLRPLILSPFWSRKSCI